MRVELLARGVALPRDLKRHVMRHIQYGLGRFQGRVRRVHVRLEDVNGPRGGEDIQVKVRAQLNPRGSVLVAETRDNPFAAVASAANRIAHRVSRKLERKRGRLLGR